MAARPAFVERTERALMIAIFSGIILVAQQYSISLFRLGLILLVSATMLQIAVGNLPRHLSAGASLLRIVIILAFVAFMFALGIFLVPFLSQLGR